MKKTLLLTCCLAFLLAPLASAETIVQPAAGPIVPTPEVTLTDKALEAALGTPAPVDLSTYITWEGGTCTAWMFCPGEPYWKCQSVSGNCHVTACSMTCNGITRTCLPRSGCNGGGGGPVPDPE